MRGHGDLGQQHLGGPASLQQMRGGFGLHHTCAPPVTGISGAHRDDDLIARGDVIQPLGPVLADPDHVAATAGADDAVGFDHPLDARQTFGQRPGLARRARLALPGLRFAGRDPLLDGGTLCLRLGDGGLPGLAACGQCQSNLTVS